MMLLHSHQKIPQRQKLLGIEGYNNHDFRTTFGTQLKENGMTSAQVADLLGPQIHAWSKRSMPEQERKASKSVELTSKK